MSSSRPGHFFAVAGNEGDCIASSSSLTVSATCFKECSGPGYGLQHSFSTSVTCGLSCMTTAARPLTPTPPGQQGPQQRKVWSISGKAHGDRVEHFHPGSPATASAWPEWRKLSSRVTGCASTRGSTLALTASSALARISAQAAWGCRQRAENRVLACLTGAVTIPGMRSAASRHTRSSPVTRVTGTPK